MSFAMPIIGRETTSHATACYFCVVSPVAKRLSKKKKLTVQYPNITSVLRPVHHNEDIPVPEALESNEIESDDEEEDNESSGPEPSTSYDHDYCPISVCEQHLITQSDLKDLEI